MCDGPALSHGPYLGTVTLCSFLSILVLSVKACVFTVISQIEAGADAEASPAYSIAKQRLHLKKSWGMPVLFLSSVVFALGHTVVAYRTSCRARRKLLLHRVDPEAVSFCAFHFWFSFIFFVRFCLHKVAFCYCLCYSFFFPFFWQRQNQEDKLKFGLFPTTKCMILRNILKLMFFFILFLFNNN